MELARFDRRFDNYLSRYARLCRYETQPSGSPEASITIGTLRVFPDVRDAEKLLGVRGKSRHAAEIIAGRKGVDENAPDQTVVGRALTAGGHARGNLVKTRRSDVAECRPSEYGPGRDSKRGKGKRRPFGPSARGEKGMNQGGSGGAGSGGNFACPPPSEQQPVFRMGGALPPPRMNAAWGRKRAEIEAAPGAGRIVREIDGRKENGHLTRRNSNRRGLS